AARGSARGGAPTMLRERARPPAIGTPIARRLGMQFRAFIVSTFVLVSSFGCAAANSTEDAEAREDAISDLPSIGAAALDGAPLLSLGQTVEVTLKSKQAFALYKIEATSGTAVQATAIAVTAARTA